MRLILSFMRFVYYFLYHPFAWMYDFVAAAVSLGRWNDWVACALPHLNGRMLELGYGPGHLQLSLHEKGLPAFGLDESRQMARQASRRLRKKGLEPRLTRGNAKVLPFCAEAFNSVVATFPAEYIFDEHTLMEIRRVLAPDGKLVVVPSAWITGKRVYERAAAWLFRVSGQARLLEKAVSIIKTRFGRAGFQVQHEIVELSGSRVLVIVARKL
jgi:ubiquinone/menaquinone biosynthesis C-methylase UbiE